MPYGKCVKNPRPYVKAKEKDAALSSGEKWGVTKTQTPKTQTP